MARGPETDEDEVPSLLDRTSLLYPNCPGCKCAHLSAKGAGPPVKELILVSSVVVCNALPISSLFPFLYFMVDDFHIAKAPEDIGYYAGAVGSIFMLGRVITSLPWGIFADKYGRRPVMILGLISIIIFQPVFGASKNFWLAFVARFLLGSFNGMLGPLKAYSSEICNAENQSWGLNVVSTSWSLGLIIGPAMGGFLSRPAINYPSIFTADSLFGRSSFPGFLSLVCVWVCFTTHCVLAWISSILTYQEYPYLLPSLCQAVCAVFELGVVYFLPETIHNHDEERPSDAEQPLLVSGKPQKVSLWRNWPLMASVAVYCVWSLHEISFSEVFSLWCVSPVETGGLGLSTSDVGTILAISGFGMLSLQLIIFSPLVNYMGPILVTRSAAIMAIPLVVLFPLMSALHGHMQWIILNLLSITRNTLSTIVITGSFLLLNNAVPTQSLGAANGISLSCVSVFRAIGPAAAGAVFAWGQSRHHATFLPGSFMVFSILDGICVMALFTMFPPFLPEVVNRRYSDSHNKHASQSGHLT